ncbi:hypothetical protein OJ962_21680, partial [Solirubrobacter sp. CPCC 204708]
GADRLAPAALAHAAALCDAPASAWRRPRVVGGALPPALEELVETIDAAQLVSLPLPAAALTRRRGGAGLGRTLAGAPFALTDAERRQPTAVVGEPGARRAALVRTAIEDARHGRRIVVLDLSGERAAWLPEPLRAQVIKLKSAAHCRIRPGATLLIEAGDRLANDALAKLLAAARAEDVPVTLAARRLSRRRRSQLGTIVAVSGGEPALPRSFLGGPLRPGQAVVHRRGGAPVRVRLTPAPATVRCPPD